jgi:hypothetical protein
MRTAIVHLRSSDGSRSARCVSPTSADPGAGRTPTRFRVIGAWTNSFCGRSRGHQGQWRLSRRIGRGVRGSRIRTVSSRLDAHRQFHCSAHVGPVTRFCRRKHPAVLQRATFADQHGQPAIQCVQALGGIRHGSNLRPSLTRHCSIEHIGEKVVIWGCWRAQPHPLRGSVSAAVATIICGKVARVTREARPPKHRRCAGPRWVGGPGRESRQHQRRERCGCSRVSPEIGSRFRGLHNDRLAF